MQIETQRLILRQWKEEDKTPFFRLNSDKEVMAFFPNVLTKEHSDALADKIHHHIATKGWGCFAVERKDTNQFIGFIGLFEPTYQTHFTPCTEIGWRLHKDHWKQGFATEGARAVLEYAFHSLQKKEIVSFTTPQNRPSIAVMERIGMTRDWSGDFDHPNVEVGHPLRPHVLYRIQAESYTQ